MAKKNGLNEWSLALLRVVLGVIFLYHGYFKLFVPGGFSGTVGFFSALHIPFPGPSALLVALVEFVGGIFLVLGFMTRWSSAALLLEMLVAFFMVHMRNGFFISPSSYGYEFVLLLIAALAVVLASGPGRLALGKNFKSKKLQ